MLPQSMIRGSAWANDRPEIPRFLAWLRPANIALKASGEMRSVIGWLAFLGTLGMAIAFAHVWLGLRSLELGYDRSAARSLIQKLELEGQRLTAEVETLESPARLEKVACGRLHMIRPAANQHLVLP